MKRWLQGTQERTHSSWCPLTGLAKGQCRHLANLDQGRAQAPPVEELFIGVAGYCLRASSL